MKIRDIAKEINLYGCMYDFKQVSISAFLSFNGFEIIQEDFGEFEYSDCKAYLDVEIKRK